MTKNFKHHLRYTRLYRIWNHIKDRCLNPKSDAFKHYGARNISICSEWKQDISIFYKWAIENGYNDNLTIDRIDNNGNYEPSNCRWVDIKTQANNKRNNHLITYNNETHTLAEWGRITNINPITINKRLSIGWSINKALTTPVRSRNQQSSDIQ